MYANPIIFYGSKTPVSERSSISSWHTKSLSKTNAADGHSRVAVCNCACVTAHVKQEINMKTIFINTRHFAVYVCCMPSRRLWWLNRPLVFLMPWLSLKLSPPEYVLYLMHMCLTNVIYKEGTMCLIARCT